MLSSGITNYWGQGLSHLLGNLIGTILRHDRKTTSYKLALVRAINDVVVGYPSLGDGERPVAIPLRLLAEQWIAYYWPFTDPGRPIPQGISPATKQDMSFRGHLTALQQEWTLLVGNSRPPDGFFLVSEMRTPRRRSQMPPALLSAYSSARKQISYAIQQPVRYAGPGQWSVFAQPRTLAELDEVVPVPGTTTNDPCLVLDAGLWRAFRDLSLWIEALCIHEWCLYSEQVSSLERGEIYTLLTHQPQNRRPLTWERNQVELLMLEGFHFRCPWTGKLLGTASYDLDHIVPISVYPINELWNLVPADRHFNQRMKRDRIPGNQRLRDAAPKLISAYSNYLMKAELGKALTHDAGDRFSVSLETEDASALIGSEVVRYVTALREARNLAEF
jgi:5-methylcytosine-specific restriction endonuclease McrA